MADSLLSKYFFNSSEGREQFKESPRGITEKSYIFKSWDSLPDFWELAQMQQSFGYRNYKEILRPIEVHEYFLLLSLHFIKTLQY